MASQLAQRHIEAQARIRGLTGGRIKTIWEALPDYNRENVPAFLSTAIPTVQAGQRQAVSTANAFMSLATKQPPVALRPEDLTGAKARRGMDPETVYRRPFIATWKALKDGYEPQVANDIGLARALTAALTDCQLAMREAISRISQANRMVLAFERVPDGNACDICVLASGQTYSKGDLMPIHPNCGCGINPIMQEAEATPPSGDMVAEISVHEHGELGPVLYNADDNFTTQSQIN